MLGEHPAVSLLAGEDTPRLLTRSACPSFCLTRFVPATVSPRDNLDLERVLQAIFTSTEVVQVNLAAATGDMGILANHAPAIEPLRPGVVEVIESGNTSKKWFGASLLTHK